MALSQLRQNCIFAEFEFTFFVEVVSLCRICVTALISVFPAATEKKSVACLPYLQLLDIMMYGIPIGNEFWLRFFCFLLFLCPSQRPSTVTIWTISYARSRARVRATYIVYRNLFTHFINYRTHRVPRMPPKQPAFRIEIQVNTTGHPIWTTPY